MEPVVDIQRRLYGPNRKGPPLLPDGDDPNAVRPVKRRKRVKEQHVEVRKSAAAIQATPESEMGQDVFVASQLPAGFPPELSFRALAAYSLLRTLSIQLGLSPFSPVAFLRALYLPFPNRLIGRVHVTLLQILFMNLKMGYHWGEKGNPPLDMGKKRKVDGLFWSLRAGDNLQFLDAFTWPVFFDDYCHLTADVLH